MGISQYTRNISFFKRAGEYGFLWNDTGNSIGLDGGLDQWNKRYWKVL